MEIYYITFGSRPNLTDKQARFSKEYMIDFNATKAAIRADYTQKSAIQIGEQNLRKDAVKARLAELKGRPQRN